MDKDPTPRPVTERAENAASNSAEAAEKRAPRRSENGELKMKSDGMRAEEIELRSSSKRRRRVSDNEKVSLSLSLTWKEVEEDFLVFSGDGPQLKPKRRDKKLHVLENSLLPGNMLMEINLKRYKI